MHILITGGTGFLGRYLVKRFIELNWQVTVLSRDPSKLKNLSTRSLQFAYWNPEKEILEIEPNSSIDIVINLAGENIGGHSLIGILINRWTPNTKARLIESRIKSGKTLTKYLRSLNIRPELFIQASAVGYYGNSSFMRVDESSACGNGFLAMLCKEWENSTAEIDAMGIRRIIVRIGIVLAKDGGILPVITKLFRLLGAVIIASGQQGISWIHIDDFVNGLIWLIQHSKHNGIYNLVAPTPVSNMIFTKTLATILKRPCWGKMPQWFIRIILGEKSDLLVQGQYVQPQRLIENRFVWKHPVLKEALEDIFYK